MSAELVERLDAWLPQTQCGRCGYPRCRDYAEALAQGRAEIDRCPPGGAVTIRALAELLGRDPKPLEAACGTYTPRQRARIEESLCIGCAKCLEACPVDAIVGSRRLMHTVIAAECSGCGLCLPSCPVECIVMEAAPAAVGSAGPWAEYTLAEARRWRERARRHDERVASGRRLERGASEGGHRGDGERERIRAEIRAAVERVRARRQALAQQAGGSRSNPADPDRIPRAGREGA